MSDALREDTRTPVPQRVAFKLDFVTWRAALTKKRRRMLDTLAAGGKTCKVAEVFGVCPARVSQMRRELADGWYTFRTLIAVSERLSGSKGTTVPRKWVRAGNTPARGTRPV